MVNVRFTMELGHDLNINPSSFWTTNMFQTLTRPYTPTIITYEQK
jgi:hypothetical protein